MPAWHKSLFSLKTQSDASLWLFHLLLKLSLLGIIQPTRRDKNWGNMYYTLTQPSQHMTCYFCLHSNSHTQSYDTNLTEIVVLKYRLLGFPIREKNTGQHLPQLNILVTQISIFILSPAHRIHSLFLKDTG